MRYEFIFVKNYSFFKNNIIAKSIHKKAAAPANILASCTPVNRGSAYNTMPAIMSAMAYNFRFVVIKLYLFYDTKVGFLCGSEWEKMKNHKKKLPAVRKKILK